MVKANTMLWIVITLAAFAGTVMMWDKMQIFGTDQPEANAPAS